MLKMRWNSVVDSTPAPVTPLRTRADLQIRSLLDDPRLRVACGLDPHTTDVPVVAPAPWKMTTPLVASAPVLRAAPALAAAVAPTPHRKFRRFQLRRPLQTAAA